MLSLWTKYFGLFFLLSFQNCFSMQRSQTEENLQSNNVSFLVLINKIQEEACQKKFSENNKIQKKRSCSNQENQKKVPNKLNCVCIRPGCNKQRFENNRALKAHIKEFHLKKSVWTCVLCRREFIHELNLEKHMNQWHSQFFDGEDVNTCNKTLRMQLEQTKNSDGVLTKTKENDKKSEL